MLVLITAKRPTLEPNCAYINPSSTNLAFCRLRTYTAFVFSSLSTSYLIFASIDRVLITSLNVQTRRRSTRRLAFVSIFSVTLFWLIGHNHALVFTSILQRGPNYFICAFNAGWYTTFTGYYTLTQLILVSLLLGIFVLWTMHNLRSRRRHIIVRVARINGSRRDTD